LKVDAQLFRTPVAVAKPNRTSQGSQRGDGQLDEERWLTWNRSE
jgi:hypothetical protein